MARVLVTGVLGCLGAWVVKILLDEGHVVIGADVSDANFRLKLVLGEKQLNDAGGRFSQVRLDIRDPAEIDKLLTAQCVDAVIHLAALQLPFCKADPVAGAQVNVVGTLNLLEAARTRPFRFVYASSTAVYGPSIGRELAEEDNLFPGSLYGVFKRADEEMAKVYAADYGIHSTGLRPWIVYGPARDQGLTADITLALKHAATGQPYHIRFGGDVRMAHASEVARAFVRAALGTLPGARLYTLGGQLVPVAEVSRLIEEKTGKKGLITHADGAMPIALETTDQAFQTDYGPFPYMEVGEGLQQTLAFWRERGEI